MTVRQVFTLEQIIGVPDDDGGELTVPSGRILELPEDVARRLDRGGAVVLLADLNEEEA